MRIEALAEAAGVAIDWKPFLLGPIFQSQGWNTSPFNLYPAKGRYMVREMERLAEQHGVPFRMPAVFPQNSLQAARLALVGVEAGWIVAFTKAVYLAEFRDGLDISSKAVLEDILRGLQLDPAALFARIADAGRQGAAQGPDGPGAGKRHLRRAVVHGRRGAVLGQRSA